MCVASGDAPCVPPSPVLPALPHQPRGAAHALLTVPAPLSLTHTKELPFRGPEPGTVGRKRPAQGSPESACAAPPCLGSQKHGVQCGGVGWGRCPVGGSYWVRCLGQGAGALRGPLCPAGPGLRGPQEPPPAGGAPGCIRHCPTSHTAECAPAGGPGEQRQPDSGDPVR